MRWAERSEAHHRPSPHIVGYAAPRLCPPYRTLLRLHHLAEHALVAHAADVDGEDHRIERLRCALDDALLRLDHGRVLLLESETAHLRDPFLQIAVELVFARLHAPAHGGEEIMRRAFVLGREQMHRVIAGAGLRRRADGADAGQQPQRRRRHPAHLGEFVDPRRMVGPERREHAGRLRIGGVAADHHVVAVQLGGDFGFDGVGIAQNALVQIRGVAQIEQIIDDELIIGLDDDAVALGRVQLRHIVEHGEVRDFAGVRRRSPHPDPERLVLLDDRIAFHPGARRNVLGAVRVAHAGTAAVEFQSVIRTLDAVAADDLAHV